MNRIAWLGQAAMCYETGIPAAFCNGYSMMTRAEQEAADAAALKYLNLFLVSSGRAPLESLKDAERDPAATTTAHRHRPHRPPVLRSRHDRRKEA